MKQKQQKPVFSQNLPIMFPYMSLESLFESLKSEALPGVWSKGLALARERAVLLEIKKPGEWILRVQSPGKTVSPRVSVWDEDDDAHCDCKDRVEPCVHVVAAVVSLKNGWATSGLDSANVTASDALPESKKTLRPELKYRFHTIRTCPKISWTDCERILSRDEEAGRKKAELCSLPSEHFFPPADEVVGQKTPQDAQLIFGQVLNNALAFDRALLLPSGEIQILRTSLVSLIGGIDSGRISLPALSVTRMDFHIDQVISQLSEQELFYQEDGKTLNQRAIRPLFEALKEAGSVTVDGNPVTVNSQPLRTQALLEDSSKGVSLRFVKSANSYGGGSGGGELREFSNGALFSASGGLRPMQMVSAKLRAFDGHEFRATEVMTLVTTLIPQLKLETNLEIRSQKLPTVIREEPRIFLEIFSNSSAYTGHEEIEVLARLVYGRPAITEIIDGRLDLLLEDSRTIPERQEAAEQKLMRDLQEQLHLKPRQRVKFSGIDAIDFIKRSSHWEQFGEQLAEQQSLKEQFSVKGELVPEVFGTSAGIAVNFSLPGASSKHTSADFSRVLAAWRKGEKLVPLIDRNGWASIPEAWLTHNMDRLEGFLALRNYTNDKNHVGRSTTEIPAVVNQLQIAELCTELGGSLSTDLKQLRERLMAAKGEKGVEFSAELTSKLPADFVGELRPYQKQGVNWLNSLRELGFGGALLSDDMGLGKTIQAICVINKRTLIIAPTSVLSSWEEQLRQFRPKIGINVYYGQARKFDSHSEVTLTSYALLRIDRALLSAENWDLIIVDESQQIKNPDSQTAKTVHELNGSFRLALTGTPIENRLDDLWSQFRFVQPGLLGARADFRENWNGGAPEQYIDRLKRRIKPFILRRLKNDVAKDLPPKTETILYSTLSESEQSAYKTILAATKEEVLRHLDAGGSVLGALEALLRLRQICDHYSLIPGFSEQEFKLSSKLELLRDTLEESLAEGHKVLIFSQWTSFLDLVEKLLNSMEVLFVRLDGTTRNRGEVISAFQIDSSEYNNPKVMLLSLKAGGIGLTLTEADHVIILDPWWNPSVEDQAADRAHRIGQTRPVLVQKIITKDTIEEKILNLQKKKQELARTVLDSALGAAHAALTITREELLELLQ